MYGSTKDSIVMRPSFFPAGWTTKLFIYFLIHLPPKGTAVSHWFLEDGMIKHQVNGLFRGVVAI